MKSLFCSKEGSFSDITYLRNTNVLASIFTNHVTRLDRRTIWQFILSLTGVRKFHIGILDLAQPTINHRSCTMELISFLFSYICNTMTSRWLNAVKSSRVISRVTVIYFTSKIVINFVSVLFICLVIQSLSNVITPTVFLPIHRDWKLKKVFLPGTLWNVKVTGAWKSYEN